MPYLIHGLAFLLDFILNLVCGKQSSKIDYSNFVRRKNIIDQQIGFL